MKTNDLFRILLDMAEAPYTTREQLVGAIRFADIVNGEIKPDVGETIDPHYASHTWGGRPFLTVGIVEQIRKFYNGTHPECAPNGYQKVPAIKWLRGVTGCGLREGKEAVEDICGDVWPSA